MKKSYGQREPNSNICSNVFKGWVGDDCIRYNNTIPSKCKPMVIGQCVGATELFFCAQAPVTKRTSNGGVFFLLER